MGTTSQKLTSQALPFWERLLKRLSQADASSWLRARISQAGCSATVILALLTVLACGSSSSKNSEPPPTIVAAPTRAATVTLVSTQIPDGKGGYFALGQSDFINGYYGTDIVTPSVPSSFQVTSEEATADKSGIFLTAPGLMWNINPPVTVAVTMTVRGVSQTIKQAALPDGNLPVSLLAFSNVFPPAFRERYDVTVASLPGASQAYSYTYSFNVVNSGATAVFAQVQAGDPGSKIVLGQGNSSFNMGTIVPNVANCSDCSISVTDVTVTAAVKSFVELPAIPAAGVLRITYPQRFSGLLVKTTSNPLTPIITGNNTPSVGINVAIPSSLTVVQPWCSAKISPPGVCTVLRQGQPVPSYFRFINDVPQDAGQQSLGGSSGIASITLSGSANVTVSRSGVVVETSTVVLGNNAQISPLNSAILPSWVLDDLRNALNSGAPQFSF